MCAMRARDGARTTGAGTKFRLLMWKNFLQQWRHRIQTVAEVLLPVATMALVLILRSEIEPATRDVSTYPVIPAGTLNYSLPVIGGMNVTRLSIAYSPESPVLDDVIRSAVTTLITRNIRSLISVILELFPEFNFPDFPDLPELPDLPDLPEIPDSINGTIIADIIKKLIRVHAYNNSESLRSIYSSEEITREVIAAVEFSDDLYGATELTGDLRYSLRFPERPRQNSFYGQGGQSWRTDLVFPYFETPGPRFPFSWEGGNDPGYVNEMFIAIQHVVSMELITHLTGESMQEFSVNVQRFPHPSYIEDFAVEALQFLFPMFIMLSFSYTAVNIVRAVTVEKELQLKETMKIMGLPTWLHWTAWFCKQFIYLLIIAILIVILVKVNWFTNAEGFSDYAVFTHTPWTVLFFFLLLYLACTIFFCFMISGLFSKASTAALFSGVIWFVSYIPAMLLAMDVEVSAGVQAFTCLSINTAMSYGFQLLLAKESTGGMQWGEFMESPSPDSNRFSFGHVVIMLTLDCVLYMLVALYLEQVLPGPYGAPKPWYFLVQKSFWFPNSQVVPVGMDTDNTQDIIMEKDPNDHAIGVKMTNLTKIYGANVAVNNLSLNIYDDQITVLLGHNGAGKSTTISMLTGNVKVSSGSVWLAGYDVAQQTAAARAHLGFCPQHNVLFNELTVREHLEFFSRLKGLRGQELKDDIDLLIAKLELEEKRDYEAAGLSGGQKRRLSVGIALSGSPRVVLLDEPTSGMDPASRRALWDLLQREKSGRSMILTTHFMDEADILGDRVAIMAGGRLQCVGSPYFLKRHYGVGYTLVVVKRHGFQYEACTEIINKYIPDITIKEDRGTEITYALTNEQAHLFEAILSDLESNVDNVKFQNYGLTATTLEDVFMSYSETETVLTYNGTGSSTSLGALAMAAYQYMFDSANIDTMKLTVVESQPIDDYYLDRSATAWFSNFGYHDVATSLAAVHEALLKARSPQANLSVYNYPLQANYRDQSNMQAVVTMLSMQLSSGIGNSLGIVSAVFIMFYIKERVSRANLLQKAAGIQPVIMWGSAALFDWAWFLIICIFIVISCAAFSVIGLSRMYLALMVYGFAMLPFHYLMSHVFKGPALGFVVMFFVNVLFVGSLIVYCSALNMVGLTEWSCMQACDYLSAVLPNINECSMEIMCNNNFPSCCAVSDAEVFGLLGVNGAGKTTTFKMLMGDETVSSGDAFVSGYSVKRDITKVEQYSGGNKRKLSTAVALLGHTRLVFVDEPTTGVDPAAKRQVWRAVRGVRRAGRGVVLTSHSMEECEALCSRLTIMVNGQFQCLGTPQHLKTKFSEGRMYLALMVYGFAMLPFHYLMSHVFKGPALGFVVMFFVNVLFVGSLIVYCSALNMVGLTEWSCMQACDYLSAVLPNINECSMEIMCNNNFPSCCVRENAYFDWEEPGIMRYMTCMLVSGGVLWALLMFIEYRVYQKTLDADVFDEMVHVERVDQASLAEHSLVAKGLSKYYGKHLAVNQVSFTVSDAEVFGLLGVNGAGKTTTFKMLMGDETVSSGDAFVSGYSVKRDITKVEQYSGGNKRKLSTAVALLGHTRLVFVDEPTTGVDPAAKRQVWRAVRGARRAGRGVVLTSHSMEECEALCSRLTIMVNGQFQCLGTPQHLKTKFSEGFTLTIKMKMDEECRNSAPGGRDIAAVKQYVESNFTTPKLMEEYQGLLTYYLPDRRVAWSNMFGTMERCRQNYDVEDYTISQTTLEQIFLQFTKYQREGL
ncbi:hypothetical protein MSG28_004122 [Choristoneura fumiferana]|uniref:Uncharacterized protein n=2 Tax=Choristoneura fumiferana TaxID=7141 RepID=A0ACC0KHD8_CHOFU|nr:hypothetical protein MSG28_004122 [Choristoneura fumiferana]